VRDQADGGPALGGAIVRRTEATQVKWTEKGYFAQYTFENTAEVPLMGVVFRNTYLGKGDEVLWRNENEFIAPDAVFLPGESKRIDYTYDSWEALKQAGVSSDAIESVRVEVVSARNAQVLGSLRFSDVSVDGDALRFSILNPGPFTIREALVRVDYKDEDGDPLRHRVSGGPVWSEPVTIRVTLRPGEKSDLFRIPNWADWDYIEGRGGSRGGDLSLVPAFAGARVNLE